MGIAAQSSRIIGTLRAGRCRTHGVPAHLNRENGDNPQACLGKPLQRLVAAPYSKIQVKLAQARVVSACAVVPEPAGGVGAYFGIRRLRVQSALSQDGWAGPAGRGFTAGVP